VCGTSSVVTLFLSSVLSQSSRSFVRCKTLQKNGEQKKLIKQLKKMKAKKVNLLFFIFQFLIFCLDDLEERKKK